MLDSSAARVFAEPNRRFRREEAMMFSSHSEKIHKQSTLVYQPDIHLVLHDREA